MTTAEFHVERSITIHAPADGVYQHLVDFRRWQAWSPWEQRDPEMQRTISEPSAGVGATYEWSGNRKAGAGRMRITAADAPRHVGVALTFLQPMKTESQVTFGLTEVGNRTTVHWVLSGPKTMLNRMFGMLFNVDHALGEDFDRGLAELKQICESPAPH